MKNPLDAIFKPRSIAVLGVSNAMHRFGGRRFRSLIEGGFDGSLYPIHPTTREVLGHKTYPSLRDVPGPVDLAVIMLRADLVDAIVDECIALNIPGVLVLTGGFGEAGEEGRASERALVEKLQAAGSRLVGPNCAGLFSGMAHVNVLGWRTVPEGSIGLITQSGNMARTFAVKARLHATGFSKIISIGNAADLKATDYIEYLFQDPTTKVILAYLEGFGSGEGRTFYELIRNHPQRKPVIVLKPGSTESGRRAALSHTGTLAGEDRIVDAALRQCGALRPRDSEEAWAATMAMVALPRMKSSRVVVVSDGGGHATVVCDAAARAGLTTPELSANTQSALAELLPPRSTMNNPVDFAGKAEEDPEIIPRVIDACLSDAHIDGAILAGHFGGYFKDRTEETMQRELAASRLLAAVIGKHRKPFVMHTVYGHEYLPTLDPLRQRGVPIFDSLELSATALGFAWRESGKSVPFPAAARAHSSRNLTAIDVILQQADGTPPGLAEPEARALLAHYDVPVPSFQVVSSGADAGAVALQFGVPVALKLISPDVVHKSEVRGVLLNIDGEAAAEHAYQTLIDRASALGARAPRVLITPMIDNGVEAVVGGFRDSQFGPVVMCGLGGIYVEVFDDIVFRLAPVTIDEARQMIEELRSAKIFKRFRGRNALNTHALAEVIAQVSELLVDLPQVKELDLNPVFVTAERVALGDARIILN